VSEENVEIVRRAYASMPDLRHDDPESIEQFLEWGRAYAGEDVELQLPSDYPEGGQVFMGHEGLAQVAAWLRETWAEWRFEPERFIEVGDRVVVLVKIVARGNSGVPVEMPTAHVVTLHSGRIASARAYRHGAEALKAVGLEE
jgi:ketosteroid isomerase-like protein